LGEEAPAKVKEVKTLKDYEELLRDLAQANPVFIPLHLKFQDLYEFHKLAVRIALVLGFLAGLALGYALGLWW